MLRSPAQRRNRKLTCRTHAPRTQDETDATPCCVFHVSLQPYQLLPAHCPLLNGSKVQINSLPLARRLRHLSVKSDRSREREAARPPRAHKRATGHSFSRLPYLKPSEPLPRRRPHPSAAVNAALGCCAPFPSRRTCAADGDALTQGSPWFADRARPNDEPSSQ